MSEIEKYHKNWRRRKEFKVCCYDEEGTFIGSISCGSLSKYISDEQYERMLSGKAVYNADGSRMERYPRWGN